MVMVMWFLCLEMNWQMLTSVYHLVRYKHHYQLLSNIIIIMATILLFYVAICPILFSFIYGDIMINISSWQFCDNYHWPPDHDQTFHNHHNRPGFANTLIWSKDDDNRPGFASTLIWSKDHDNRPGFASTCTLIWSKDHVNRSWFASTFILLKDDAF